MFSKKTAIMLYVSDVAAEKAFWSAIGFTILSEGQLMNSETFDMTPSADATSVFTVMDKETIRQISPEVVDHQPSLLFETEELEKLHDLVQAFAPVCNPISDVPFKHFNFASPSGHYYAVKEA